MRTEDLLFVGVKRRVLALSRSTGTIIWETELNASALSGDTFVNVFVDRDDVFAHTKGVLFCLDAQTGRLKWENPLRGCGYGIATLAAASGSAGNLAAIEHKRRQDAAAANAATSANAAST